MRLYPYSVNRTPRQALDRQQHNKSRDAHERDGTDQPKKKIFLNDNGAKLAKELQINIISVDRNMGLNCL